MGTITPVVILLFVFLTFVIGQRDTLIATGRGVLAPDQVLKKIHEVPFNTSYRWQLIQDSRFPNGYFIHNNYYQVWDVSGGAATNGAPILLYQKKDTLVGTKNQRWVNSTSNQFEIIMNSNYVAKVNANKRLVLATKSASDPFQKFYLIDIINNLTRLAINNQRNECIRIVAAPSVLGDHLNTTQCDHWATYTTVRGGKVDIFDAAGNYLQQDYVMHSRDVTLSFLVSYPAKLLEGTATWKGPTRQPDPTIDSNVRLTFTATVNEDWRNGAINGTGTDAFGTFRVHGDYSGRPGTAGDYVYLFKSYASTYKLVQTCYADSIGATVIEGLCESSASSEVPPSNSFRWEKQV